MQASAPLSATRAQSPEFIRRAIEIGWLVAAVTIPLAIVREDFLLGWIQMPKVFMLRTSAIALAALLILEWALRAPAASAGQSVALRFGEALRRHPGRLVYFATAAVVFSNLISVALSPVRAISIWGINPGWDTYGFFNIASYVVIFLTVALHLRRREQLVRLLWALTAVSMLTSIYGIGQHFGYDFIRSNPVPITRATLTFGNPIFGGAYLLMTIPLTTALWMGYRERLSVLAHLGIGSGLIALQFTALLFNLSRGPWAGFWVAVVAFFILLAWVIDRVETKRAAIIAGIAGFGMLVLLVDIVALGGQWFTLLFYAHATSVGLAVFFLAGDFAKRALAMVLVAAAFALLMTVLPVRAGPSTGGGGLRSLTVGERIGDIGTSVDSGLTNRQTIWTTAGEVFLTTPWVDTERFPEIPDLGFRLLRPLVGYGPDMFGFAYPLAGETTYTVELATHGHNFIVHTALELGLLGVLSYLMLIGALFYYLFRMMLRAREGTYPPWLAVILVGITTVLIGRVVEQIPGKAQVSDLTLSWILAGVVIALTTIRFDDRQDESSSTEKVSGHRPVGPPRAGRRAARRVKQASKHQGGLAKLALLLDGPAAMMRLGGALLLVVILAAFWSQAVVPPVRSSITAREAQDLLEAGETQAAVDRYLQAIEENPQSVTNRLDVSHAIFGAAANDPDRDNQANLLSEAVSQTDQILLRNPLDHRGWSGAGQFQRALSIVEGDMTQEAVRGNQVLVGLMPGLWQSWAALAFAYYRIGDNDLAASMADEAIAISNGARESGFVHYVKAVSLENLGRYDEAVDAANESIRLEDNTDAQELLARIASMKLDSAS